MEWCLDCHRNPERYVRPREAVFRVDYEPPAEPARARHAAGRGVSDSEAHELLDVPPMNGEPRDGSGPGTGGSERTRAAAARPPFWRTLEERADDPAFQERLYNEFPSQIEAITDPVARRTFLKLMGASLALAGVTACTRQPPEKIVPYVRQPEELVPGQAAVLRDRDAARRRRHRPARREPRRAADQDRRQPAPSRQPRRDRRLRAGGDSRPLRSRPLADADATSARSARGRRSSARSARRSTAQQPLQGRRPSHPDRVGQLADAGGADPRAARALPVGAGGISGIPASRDNARAGAKLAFGEYVDAQYRFEQADVILSLDADFLGCGPGCAALRARFRRRGAGPSRPTA